MIKSDLKLAGQLIRCSALGNIMTAARGTEITAKQLEELADLLSKIKLTEKQALRRDELIAKRDAKPELSVGAKTFLKQLYLEEVFGRRKDIQTKYTEKGTLMELEGVKLANSVLDWGMSSSDIAQLEFSKLRWSNDFITGEMDINTDTLLADIKCPWDIFTFPFFDKEIPNSNYYWQLQGYMMLTGHDQAQLVYTLVDAPEHIILDEQRRTEWQRKDIELPDDVADAIRNSMTFADIPAELRVKRWVISRNESDFAKIKEHVLMAREYLIQLNEEMSNFFANNMAGLN